MIVDNPGLPVSLLCSSADCLTEVSALCLLTGRELPLVISSRDSFDGHLDTVVGRLSVPDVCQVLAGGKESRGVRGHHLGFTMRFISTPPMAACLPVFQQSVFTRKRFQHTCANVLAVKCQVGCLWLNTVNIWTGAAKQANESFFESVSIIQLYLFFCPFVPFCNQLTYK